MRRLAVTALAMLLATPASAAEPTDDAGPRTDVRAGVPNVAYAFSGGSSDGVVGAQAYGLGLAASGQRAVLGGGASAWGTIGRLTLIGDASRGTLGRFAPSAGVIVRIVGDETASLGALGRYKIEGFGVGPNGELESEVETGLVLTTSSGGWHLDANAIGGVGLGDAGELDVEGRLRGGRDLGPLLRVGFDGQTRLRALGDARLPGGRTWDFSAGPQLLVGSGALFGALTAGPTTSGVDRGVGWTAIVSLGGARL